MIPQLRLFNKYVPTEVPQESLNCFEGNGDTILVNGEEYIFWEQNIHAETFSAYKRKGGSWRECETFQINNIVSRKLTHRHPRFLTRRYYQYLLVGP